MATILVLIKRNVFGKLYFLDIIIFIFIFFVECCDTVDDYIDLGFHSIHSKNISLLCKNTKARHVTGHDVCFMNQPMKFGKKIYTRVSGMKEHPRMPMDFGVTNDIHVSDIEAVHLGNLLSIVYLPFSSSYDDVICFCLNKDSTCSYSINKGEELKIPITCVSISSPVWLFFQMYDVTEIEISSEEIEGNWKKQLTFFKECQT